MSKKVQSASDFVLTRTLRAALRSVRRSKGRYVVTYGSKRYTAKTAQDAKRRAYKAARARRIAVASPAD